ncbi:DUF2218 domain-containing protein [Dongia sp.]|uniref:DUF2218 domain-containing protein n=1 Tax=Dongia sp. TaxID=1977262 RepID=UPI0035B1C26E
MSANQPTTSAPAKTNTNTLAFSSVARVPTDKAARYMGQLCKHFAHKIPATFDAETGRIEFSIGVCELAAAKDALAIHVSAADEETLAQMEDVVARHLVRFGFRDELVVNWQRGA